MRIWREVRNFTWHRLYRRCYHCKKTENLATLVPSDKKTRTKLQLTSQSMYCNTYFQCTGIAQVKCSPGKYFNRVEVEIMTIRCQETLS